MTTRSKRFSFTLNNYQDSQKERLQELLTDGLITYLVWGEEIAPTTGTPHLQGYMEVEPKTTMKVLQRKLALPIALLVSKGTAEANKTYCLKSGGLSYEKGQPMKQGERSDLELIVQMIQEGKTYQQIWETHPTIMIIHRRGVKEALEALQNSFVNDIEYEINDYDEKMVEIINEGWNNNKSIILWGPSNCGKTTLCRVLLPKALIVTHIDDLLQFNEKYEGIIFDDLSFNHIHREGQIQILDNDISRSIHCRYACAKIPAKTKKIFTTNNTQGAIFLIGDEAISRRQLTVKFTNKP